MSVHSIASACATSAGAVVILPDMRADVGVVGGGMAGLWTAYQLAKAGVRTILITYQAEDRGGVQGASRRSAGAFNTCALSNQTLEEYLQEIGRGQTHPSVAPSLSAYLPQALEELAQLTELKPIKLGLALGSGSGQHLLEKLATEFVRLGGQMINGWVTRLMSDPTHCRGVQYESPEGVGKLVCRALVLAPGGYAGLFRNAIRTNCFGNVLGSYLMAGGIATNLEFLFKHGYGNIDANALTPTEELPGAEIYDTQHSRVTWLEQLLFHKQGTKTHLQAAQFWLRNSDTEFYVDLSFRALYMKLWELNSMLEDEAETEAEKTRAMSELLALFPEKARAQVTNRIIEWLHAGRSPSYSMFEELKPVLETPNRKKFRVQPLTYFSMGGMSHVDFATNLKNTFVAGEAMHDFGANRVGGLPWSLYLASGAKICEQIMTCLAEDAGEPQDFEVIPRKSKFDPDLLQGIQSRLYEFQEKEMTGPRGLECIEWFRSKREALQAETGFLHDGISWLLVAEAIMQCSMVRTESRGFFFRFDFQTQDEKLNQLLSCTWYDAVSDSILARLSSWDELSRRVRPGNKAGESRLAYGSLAQHF